MHGDDILSQVTRVDEGYRIKVVDGYVVEAWKMLYNWRLVVFKDGQNMLVDHGYCYFGTDAETLTRTLLAGLAWDDPANTEPIGYDKKAF